MNIKRKIEAIKVRRTLKGLLRYALLADAKFKKYGPITWSNGLLETKVYDVETLVRRMIEDSEAWRIVKN